jgi:uncharacterized membrane protein
MFQFLFKYPASIFSKGQFVLLGWWPRWILVLSICAVGVGFALLIRARLPQAAPKLRSWRAGALWLLEFALAAVLLLLLWQPALTVAELKPQQNIIAVIVDDSRSMAIADNGSVSRQTQAVNALEGGVLRELEKNYQTRLYSLDSRATRIAKLGDLHPTAASTRIGDSLKQLVAETSDLPIGAIVLMSDGEDNTGGIDLDTIAALRNRHIPVHTVGFGLEETPQDVEINDVVVAPRALENSRLSAVVTFHQRGYAGKTSTLAIRDGNKVLASHPITFAADGKLQTESLLFNAGDAGAKTLEVSIDPLAGEQNRANNAVSRVVNVSAGKMRILYVEGEPRWEYKFIRRAEDEDTNVEVASMLRTTENKIYRQGIDSPTELADGFPSRAEDLFAYQGIILGSVEAGYFTPAQQDLIRQFVDRRGGGLLLLGGRFGLADGGWSGSPVADALPVVLPSRYHTFHRDHALAELTPAGRDSLVTRLVDDPAKNAEQWKKLPYLMDDQEPGNPKPGAVVLAEMRAGGRTLPLLITQNFGRGRSAVLATSGTWRWQMSMPVGDTSHDMFWRQLLRWLVIGTPGNVVASVPNQVLYDDGLTTLSADVRDKEYQPAADAQVEARVIGPGGISTTVEMRPVADNPGVFQTDWTAPQPGSYLAEMVARRGDQELGRDVLTYQRIDGVAENFHTGQNRDLLEKLSSQTGARYWRPQELSQLPGEIPVSEAGITVRATKELWNMPALFLLILLLMCSEWLLRRKWGVV